MNWPPFSCGGGTTPVVICDAISVEGRAESQCESLTAPSSAPPPPKKRPPRVSLRALRVRHGRGAHGGLLALCAFFSLAATLRPRSRAVSILLRFLCHAFSTSITPTLSPPSAPLPPPRIPWRTLAHLVLLLLDAFSSSLSFSSSSSFALSASASASALSSSASATALSSTSRPRTVGSSSTQLTSYR